LLWACILPSCFEGSPKFDGVLRDVFGYGCFGGQDGVLLRCSTLVKDGWVVDGIAHIMVFDELGSKVSHNMLSMACYNITAIRCIKSPDAICY
jgi:hypothetical protein